MVLPLKPGKFYGSSLPRPRIYTDIKYNTDRVDPPLSVLDPLMSWAEEAHWSMGGLSFTRHHLQGRIEGNIDKIRNQIDESIKKKESLSPKFKKMLKTGMKTVKKVVRGDRSVSPPRAPIAKQSKRRFIGLVDEEEVSVVRKLSDEFDEVASPKKGAGEGEGETVASRTRGRKVESDEGVKRGKKRLRKVGESKE